jgi:hypothetical protein
VYADGRMAPLYVLRLSSMQSGRLHRNDLTEGCLLAAGRGPKDRVCGLGVWERSVEIGQEDESLVKQQRPGDRCDVDGDLSYSTASSYLSVIKQVRLKWGETRISRMKPLGVQEWLKKMDAAPKTKGHVKALMHRLYEKAMVEWQRNPMQLVEIKGISKRKKKLVVLTVQQYYLLLGLIPPPYRTMVMVAQCTGLRPKRCRRSNGRTSISRTSA